MTNLFFFYAILIGCPTIGYILRIILPISFVNYTYQFIVWIATPTLVFTAYRNNNLGDFASIPFIAMITTIISAVFMWIMIDIGYIHECNHLLSNINKTIQNFDFKESNSNKLISLVTLKNIETQTNLFINSSISNTSYVSFPIILLILDTTQSQYFTWGVVFNLFNSGLTLCILFAISYIFKKGKISFKLLHSPISIFLRNPVFWSLLLGLLVSLVISFDKLEVSLSKIRYLIICLDLIAIGTQFSFPKIKLIWNQSFMILLVKMLITPLVVSALLMLLNITSVPLIIVLLQIAMPPLILSSEIYKQSNLSKNLNMAAHSIGCVLLAFTVPIWVFLFR